MKTAAAKGKGDSWTQCARNNVSAWHVPRGRKSRYFNLFSACSSLNMYNKRGQIFFRVCRTIDARFYVICSGDVTNVCEEICIDRFDLWRFVKIPWQIHRLVAEEKIHFKLVETVSRLFLFHSEVANETRGMVFCSWNRIFQLISRANSQSNCIAEWIFLRYVLEMHELIDLEPTMEYLIFYLKFSFALRSTVISTWTY